jgi:hypothetical protein
MRLFKALSLLRFMPRLKVNFTEDGLTYTIVYHLVVVYWFSNDGHRTWGVYGLPAAATSDDGDSYIMPGRHWMRVAADRIEFDPATGQGIVAFNPANSWK